MPGWQTHFIEGTLCRQSATFGKACGFSLGGLIIALGSYHPFFSSHGVSPARFVASIVLGSERKVRDILKTAKDTLALLKDYQ
jgi:hypothetical protein